ncbi:MAG TPA: hypothetical protein VKV29_01170 [Chthonomonas sp.]|jgi:hypothetical protein|uniref:hypothetical protein n=1 Tax=Chthonomonas sp. TaxID=2282153 RepID=UPI002B4B10C8|nr:hypothetical protein [Chthonomonas sp.]HLH78872.1 hypothetical protein [Chthonomonas sp.]
MKNEDTRLKIVRLLEPSLCLSCRYASIATVEMENGTSRRMLHCRRLDCDNWQTEEVAETPRAIQEES